MLNQAMEVSNNKSKIAIGIGILGAIVGVIAIILVSLKMTEVNTLKASLNQLKVAEDVLRTKYETLNSRIASSPQALPGSTLGPQGPRGPLGPQGPPGGTYAGAGPLVNMSNKKLCTPTYGKGLPALVYMDDKHYSPIQYWFLQNNPNGTVAVKNKYTDYCLTANNLGDIYSDVCNSSDANQQFTWSKSMQLSSSGFNNKCISLSDWNRTNADNPSFNYSNLEAKNGSNSGNVQKLKLEACSASLNPKQTWYIGN